MSTSSTRASACFIDSNIWIYAFLEQQDTHKTQRAKDIIQAHSPIFISTQIINEVAHNLIRKAGFTEQEIRTLIQEFHDMYVVIELKQSVLLQASLLREHHGFAYWDSIIIASALESTAPTLFSEDMHDGMVIEQRLSIVNPFKM